MKVTERRNLLFVENAAQRNTAIAVAAGVLMVVAAMLVAALSGDPIWIGMAALPLLFGLLILGVPVAVSMGISGIISILFLRGPDIVAASLSELPFNVIASWQLSVLPMFILMGTVLHRSGVTADMFIAMRQWLSWLPGGLAVSTNVAGAALGTASGSTTGITYALGRIAVPEMRRAGYTKRLSIASVLMAGTGGQLLPPSILAIVYAGMAQTPFGEQLLAGLLPGIALHLIYTVQIIIAAKVGPDKVTHRERSVTSRQEAMKSVARIWPMPGLVLVVVGGLYSGIFTATEAGAIGALGAVVVAFVGMRGRITHREFGRRMAQALFDAVGATGMIMLILIGASLLARSFALSGVSRWFVQPLIESNLPFLEIVVILVALYFVLGMIMDPISMMLLTVPIVLPVVESAGGSAIWFGVFLVLMGEVANVSPPVGVNCFVMAQIVKDKSIRKYGEITLIEIFKAALWFLPAAILLMVIIVLFPASVEWLPKLMR